ncbi:MAG: hypothetical protein V9F04_14925 [Dermatophilaceae bacterium]
MRISDLDLIVVRHAGRDHDGRGRRATRCRRSTLLEALALAHAEIRRSATRSIDLARQAGKPKWVDAGGERRDGVDARRPHRRRSSPSAASPGVAAGGRRGDRRRAAAAIATDVGRGRRWCARTQVALGRSQFLADERRAAAVKAVVADAVRRRDPRRSRTPSRTRRS